MRFETMVPLEGVPGGIAGPYMTEDCARVYFSAAQSILYVQQ